MSSGVNRAILVGNLGTDPDLQTIPSGKQVAEFRLATSRKWSDAEGELKEATEWHTVVVWDRMAAICHQYLSKGRQVYVEGRIRTEKWTNREGQERTTTKVVATQVIFLGGEAKVSGMVTSRDAGPTIADAPPW